MKACSAGATGPSLAQRAKAFIWPERGFSLARGAYVVARLARLETSPHAIAAGFAAGAAVSFTPLLGLHFLLAFVLCFVTRGSFVAAVAGTVVGNPLTFPFIFAATYWLGTLIRRLVVTPPEDALDVVAEGLAEGFDAESEARAGSRRGMRCSIRPRACSRRAGASPPWRSSGRRSSTMLIGAVPLVVLAYAGFYVLVRAAVAAFQGARAAGAQSARAGGLRGRRFALLTGRAGR